jgi:hypothetical protein
MKKKKYIFYNKTKFVYTKDHHIIKTENIQCYNFWCKCQYKGP